MKTLPRTPAQPLLPARRPRAPAIADSPTAEEASAEVEPLVAPVQAPVQVAPAIDASSEDVQKGHSSPCSHSHTWTTTSSPTEPEAKKQKQQQEEDDDDLAMDSFHPSTTILMNNHQLLLRILKLAGRAVGHTAKFQKLLLSPILNLVLIRHVNLDKRNLLPEQIQQQEESRTASWVHTTDAYPDNLWTDFEYARKACDRTGARINFVIRSLEFGPEHPRAKPHTKVAIPGLLPYLDDYIMSAHDPYVEDFHWSMDDNRHTESQSPELTEGDVPNLLLFAERDVINRVRTEAAGSVAQVAGRDTRGARAFDQTEVRRHRQGLKKNELSSSDVLDVTVFNLGNLARQSIQRQAEPRMLRLIMDQTSHIMMLVEGTSLSVNQWDKKLKEANWTLSSSDDRHH